MHVRPGVKPGYANAPRPAVAGRFFLFASGQNSGDFLHIAVYENHNL